jgi:hypothetical protein
MPNSSRLSPWKAEVIETRASEIDDQLRHHGPVGTDGGTLESAGPPRLGPAASRAAARCAAPTRRWRPVQGQQQEQQPLHHGTSRGPSE